MQQYNPNVELHKQLTTQVEEPAQHIPGGMFLMPCGDVTMNIVKYEPMMMHNTEVHLQLRKMSGDVTTIRFGIYDKNGKPFTLDGKPTTSILTSRIEKKMKALYEQLGEANKPTQKSAPRMK